MNARISQAAATAAHVHPTLEIKFLVADQCHRLQE